MCDLLRDLAPRAFPLRLLEFRLALAEAEQHLIVLLHHQTDLIVGLPDQRLVSLSQRSPSECLRYESQRKSQPLRNEIRKAHQNNENQSKNIQDVCQHADLYFLQKVDGLKKGNTYDSDEGTA